MSPQSLLPIFISPPLSFCFAHASSVDCRRQVSWPDRGVSTLIIRRVSTNYDMAPPPTPHSRILEINLISAEDLAPVSKNMKTYAVAWVQPDHKLATGIDQTGRTDPTWNEKFMFRVDDKFLNSEDAAIVVEIYAAAWVKDVLIGYVNVIIKDIFHLRSIADAKINYSATRTVTLQIRRPSGRPQGILNMEVILLDSTTPSVPEPGDPKPKTTSKNEESFENNNELESHKSSPNAKISRSQSDVTDSTMEDNLEKGPQMGSILNDGSGSEVKGCGSMVNGSSICSSDVGPSASIVAAAIAKGLYKPPIQHQAQTKETRLIREWTRKKEESVDEKLEKWRTEMSQPASAGKQKAKSSKARRSRGNRGDDAKLFSCFGNAFGCEISITCGGSKKKHGNGNNKICHLSSVDDNYSQSFV